MDPKFPNQMGCYGFAFTMPGGFNAPDVPVPPPSSLFVLYTDNDYFMKGKVTFNNKDGMGMAIKAGAACEYNDVPMQPVGQNELR